MGLTTTPLSAEDRLAILRASDENRKWHTLDERRICMACNRVFDGQEIRITSGAEGRYQLHCPTDDCEALPHDWFFYGSGLAADHSAAAPACRTEFDFNFG